MSSTDGNLNDRILVAVEQEGAYVRVMGRGSYSNSTSLKDFGLSIAAKNALSLNLDLSECSAMDSTFMGVIVGFCDAFSKEASGSFRITGASPGLVKCMTTLGLHHLIDLSGAQESAEKLQQTTNMEMLAKSDVSDLSTAQTMLEAHQNLVNLDESNRDRFKDVLEYLKQDVEKKKE